VAGVFTALSLGVAYVGPVLVYDCARAANGSVDCVVHRRMFGLIPLGDVRLSRILSAEIAFGEDPPAARVRSRPTPWDALRLVCADGTRW
jgi:hypothetical protein